MILKLEVFIVGMCKKVRIKILVADDDPFIRKLIRAAIKEDHFLEIIDISSSGYDIAEKVQRVRPDVVVMASELSAENVAIAVADIMRAAAAPIIMLASPTYYGIRQTIAALHEGAIDFVQKPKCEQSSDEYDFQVELLQKIKAAAKVNYLSPWSGVPFYAALKMMSGMPKTNPYSELEVEQIVAIGAAAGGTQVLSQILSALPSSFAYPILIVQHMPPRFTAALAEHLDSISALRVKEACHGDIVLNGHVYVAPGGSLMKVVNRNGRLRIALQQQEQEELSVWPINELFASVSKLRELKSHYVVLTGNGKDGAQQLPEAKQAGAASIIAQDKMKCTVFEMPRAAIESGTVDYIMPLEKIADKLVEVTSRVIV